MDLGFKQSLRVEDLVVTPSLQVEDLVVTPSLRVEKLVVTPSLRVEELVVTPSLRVEELVVTPSGRTWRQTWHSYRGCLFWELETECRPAHPTDVGHIIPDLISPADRMCP